MVRNGFSKTIALVLLLTTTLAANTFAKEPTYTHQPKQIAALTISSLSNVNDALYSGLSGIGAAESKKITDEIFQWLFMVPSLDCADKTREATVCLLTPKNNLDIPDKAAVLPLNSIGGASQLVSLLRQTYNTITGTNLLFCSNPVDTNKFSDVCMYITRTAALVANNRESLIWIARQYAEKSLPSIEPVRGRAPIALTFDGNLCYDILSVLIPQNNATTGLPVYLTLLKELFSTVNSLDLSIEPDAIDWRIACRLNYPAITMLKFEDTKIGKTTKLDNEFPIFSHCQSISYLPLVADILPLSILNKLEKGIGSIYNGMHILPAMPEANNLIRPYLTGERASAIATSPRDNLLGKIEIFPISDLPKLEAALQKITYPKDVVKKQLDRKAYGTTIRKYTIVENTDEINSKGAFIAHVLSMLYGLNNIEFAISNGKLYVASGPREFIDNWLKKARFPTKKQNAIPIGRLPHNEIPIGGGIQDISSLIETLTKNTDQLEGISRNIPISGSGIQWQISRGRGFITFDILASSSELLALTVLSKIDTSQIGSLILDKAAIQR